MTTVWGVLHRYANDSIVWIYSTSEKADEGAGSIILEYLGQVKRIAPDIADAIEAMVKGKMYLDAIKAWNDFHVGHAVVDEIKVDSHSIDSGPGLPL